MCRKTATVAKPPTLIKTLLLGKAYNLKDEAQVRRERGNPRAKVRLHGSKRLTGAPTLHQHGCLLAEGEREEESQLRRKGGGGVIGDKENNPIIE